MNEPNWNLNILDIDNNSKCTINTSGRAEILRKRKTEIRRKRLYDVNNLNIVLKLLLEVWKEVRESEKILPQELNVYLSEFIVVARTKKGKQSERSSLIVILLRVERYIESFDE